MIQQSRFNFKTLFVPLSVFLAITIYLSFFSNHKIIWLYFSIITLFPILLKPKLLFITLSILIIVFPIHFATQMHPITQYIKGNYKVIKNTSMGPIIKANHEYIFIKTKENFNIGDIIKVNGQISQIKNNSDFDKVTYFKSLNVINQIEYPKVTIIEKTNDFRIDINNFILNSNGYYSKVTPLILLGKKNIDSKEIYDIAIKMNIVHLFVISGFHISLFFMIINKLLKIFKVKENISLWISIIPIIIYLFILNFPISATRAVLLVICLVVNKTLLKSKFSSLEGLSFVMALMFIIKPRSIYSLSFIFTFIATFVVIISNQIKFKNKTIKYILIIIFAFLSNLLIVMYQNNFFSVFGIIYGTILSPIFVILYSFTIFLFPIKGIMEYIDMIFVYILYFFNETNIVIEFHKFSINWVFLSYGFILSSLIILLIWNFYMEKKAFLWRKN